jgi:hypothetical protein
MQHIFTTRLNSGADEPSGGDAIRLNLTGDSKETQIWQDAVLSNLSLKESDIKNLQKTPVARHHWMIEQLDYFKTHRPGTPVPYEIIKKHAYSFDPQDMILKGLTVLYFQLPNHPHDKVKYYAYGAEERDDRACAREEAREDARAKRHKEALDNLT